MYSTNQRQAVALRAAALSVLFGLIQVPAFAQPSSAANEAMTNSVVTVDSLLKIENGLALEKARRDAIGAGLLRPPEAKAAAGQAALPPATLQVTSIFGADGVLRANVLYNGALYEGVRIGAPIGKCAVTGIRSTSVQLTPSKGVPASQCPTGVWTGESAQGGTFAASLLPAGGGAATPLPSGPLPAGLTSAVALPQAAGLPGARRFEPAVDMRAQALPPGQSNGAAAN